MTLFTRNDFEELKQVSRGQTGSLIITLFGDMILPRGGSIWLGSLIRLLEPLDLNTRLVRTSVFRLAQGAWLQTETVGRRANYQLTAAGLRRFEKASDHIYASVPPEWDQQWRLILVVAPLAEKQRKQLRQSLFWQGFGMLKGDVFVHPSADLIQAFDVLLTEEMEDILDQLMPLVASKASFLPTANAIDLVKNAWNLEQLSESYHEFIVRYQRLLSTARYEYAGHISPEDAYIFRILLIHDYRRLLLRDPELPKELLPQNWPGETARALCKEIYQWLLAPSEHFLDTHLQLADGSIPRERGILATRFKES